jgi:hypothetical protein
MSVKGVFVTDPVKLLVASTETQASAPFGFNKTLIDTDDDVTFFIMRFKILGGNGKVSTLCVCEVAPHKLDATTCQ